MRNLVRNERGVAPVVLVIIGLVVVYIVGSAASLATSGTSNEEVAAERTCFSKCGFFMERRCEDNAYMGACFPFWACSWHIGTHLCADAASMPDSTRPWYASAAACGAGSTMPATFANGTEALLGY